MALLNLIVSLTLVFVTIETKEELIDLNDVSAIVGEKFDYQIGNEAFLSTYKIYRIVQRGQRKLPSWLTFDTNSSMLIGYPKKEDVGMYTVRMRAQCIDPTVSNCQDKLSRTFHITVYEPLISAESRGRKTFSKHGKKEKWKITNKHNGNTGLYVEYDISRHGTVVEKKPGMLDSGSKHVLSNGVLYSAMQFYSVAKYFSNKNLHDKLSRISYLAMQYNSASINFLRLRDNHDQFPSIVSNYLSMHSFINNIHIHDSDMLSFPSSVLYSSLQHNSIIDRNQYSVRPVQHFMTYNSRSNSVQFSDKVSLHKAELFSSMQMSVSHNSIQKSEFLLHETSPTDKDMLYYPTFFQDRGFRSHIGAKTSKELSFTKHSVITSKRFDEEKSEESIYIADKTFKNNFIPKSSQNSGSPKYGVPNLCVLDQTTYYASLILHVLDSLTSSQEDILIHKWSNFISKDHNLIFISRSESDYKGLTDNGKYILTAGPGNVIESLSESVELSWHLACDVFEQIEDFTRVIQHNIEFGRVSKEIGFDVIAWFVYTDRPFPKRVKRQAHSRRRQTATPTYSPPVPTTLSEIFSTTAPDESPKLEKSIDHLDVVIGRYFEYEIPEDTFSDKEDGNTRNLTLRLSLTYSKPFPKGAWLMFNETSQTFYGIPLRNDSEGGKRISEFTLIAKDSKGQVAKDAISLTYKYEKNLNHKIGMTLNGSYEKFTDDREQLIQVAKNIGDFYGDEKLNFLSFSGVEKGSVVIIWSNNSLTGTPCQKGMIQNLYDRLADENGTISDQFIALFRDYIPVNISLEFLGACLLPVTSLAPPTETPVTETDNKMWIEIVLPALIAILVIVIIALLLLICCRHQRPSKEIKDSDKPAFLEDRRPIIFPDELEMVDPSLKPKTPLVLPSDYLSETPPAVPPHGRQAPPYRAAMLDDDRFPGEDEDQPIPPSYRGDSQNSEPPPYRLPPPYFNPHRLA